MQYVKERSFRQTKHGKHLLCCFLQFPKNMCLLSLINQPWLWLVRLSLLIPRCSTDSVLQEGRRSPGVLVFGETLQEVPVGLVMTAHFARSTRLLSEKGRLGAVVHRLSNRLMACACAHYWLHLSTAVIVLAVFHELWMKELMEPDEISSCCVQSC